MIAYEQAPNWAGVKKEIEERSLQGVPWGRKTGVGGGGGEGGCRLCVDATHWPTCNYPVTNMSVTCQLGYETNQIRFLHLNASASITFACT